MQLLFYQLQKTLVETRVLGQLRMERGDEEAPLSREHRVALHRREHVDLRPDVLDPRRTDEDRVDRLRLPLDVEVGLEARDLTAERVPRRLDVDEAEVVPVEHDHAGARAENGPLEPPHRLVEAV